MTDFVTGCRRPVRCNRMSHLWLLHHAATLFAGEGLAFISYIMIDVKFAFFSSRRQCRMRPVVSGEPLLLPPTYPHFLTVITMFPWPKWNRYKTISWSQVRGDLGLKNSWNTNPFSCFYTDFLCRHTPTSLAKRPTSPRQIRQNISFIRYMLS